MLRLSTGRPQKELPRSRGWIRARPTWSTFRNNLPLLAAPLKTASERPICCTVQGEDLFREGLPGAYKTRALTLDPCKHFRTDPSAFYCERVLR